MTVEKAHAFLDELKEKGHSPELMAKIGTHFTSDHINEALESKGKTKDDLLKAAAGGSATTDWIGAGTSCVCAAASAA